MHTLIRIDTIDASDVSVFPKDKLSAIEVRVRAHSKLIRRAYRLKPWHFIKETTSEPVSIVPDGSRRDVAILFIHNRSIERNRRAIKLSRGFAIFMAR